MAVVLAASPIENDRLFSCETMKLLLNHHDPVHGLEKPYVIELHASTSLFIRKDGVT